MSQVLRRPERITQLTVIRAAASTTIDRDGGENAPFTCVTVSCAIRHGPHRLPVHCFGIVVPSDLLDGLVRAVSTTSSVSAANWALSMGGSRGKVKKERFADRVAGWGRYLLDIHRRWSWAFSSPDCGVA